ncbi:MAG TPA: hypothetical protein VNA04_06720 [Thermoanaerobaculia bacterium]|nr:hypothetical protein [Thermoanaerobaculia bacterium]
MAKLEKLFRAVLRAMRPDGLLYLDEYIGPSRTEWSGEILTPHRAVHASLPPEIRNGEDLPDPVQADDPSEAIRSSEIEPQMRIGFETMARRPYGGTLLSVLIPRLRRDRLTDSLLERLIDEERLLLARGGSSYYAIIVARPRRGLARLRARIHYFAVPKLKRSGS